MTEKSTQEINYTVGHDPETLKSHGQRHASFCAAYLLPHIRPTDHILDVGCGPGTITLDLAERASSGLTVGIDSGLVAIEAAQKEVRRRGGTLNCEFKTGNVYALEWGVETFDIVHAHQCLIHLTDPAAALREMRRVCRVGGIVAARDADFATFSVYPDHPLLLKSTAIFENVIRGGGSEPNAGRRLASWAREAGYQREEIQVSASVEVYSTRAERNFWATGWSERLRHSQVGTRGVELGVTTREEIEKIAKAWEAWIDDDDGYFAVPSTEILCWKKSYT